MVTESVCKRCNRVHGVDGYTPMHRPVYDDDSSLPTPERDDHPMPPMPFDPVLRQALIDKGVLVPDDLTAAEDKIRAVTGAVLGDRDRPGNVWRES